MKRFPASPPLTLSLALAVRASPASASSRAMVQVLPKDFQVWVNQQNAKWVINASPKELTEQQWREMLKLPIAGK
jgi:hypothetical protein